MEKLLRGTREMISWDQQICSPCLQDFNTVIRDVQTKPRSYSESGPSAPYANFKSPNGKLPSDKSMVEIISSRSRTNSNPVPFNYGQSSGATR